MCSDAPARVTGSQEPINEHCKMQIANLVTTHLHESSECSRHKFTSDLCNLSAIDHSEVGKFLLDEANDSKTMNGGK